jgi:hypothetical protein
VQLLFYFFATLRTFGLEIVNIFQALTHSINRVRSTSWEATSRLTGERTLRLLWDTKIYTSPLMNVNMYQLNVIQILKFCSFKIYFNIIFSSTRNFPSILLNFRPKIFVACICAFVIRATYPSHHRILPSDKEGDDDKDNNNSNYYYYYY